MKERKIVTCFLPEDIITEILSRLDVKSLMRFKCVCKSWQCLICGPTFTRMHFDHQPSSVIVFDHFEITKFSVHGSQNFGEKSSTYKIPKKISNEFPTNLVIDSDHGILCLSDYFLHNVYLWNPATNEVKKLPPLVPPSTSPRRESLCLNFRIGFGFDPLTNDFKVLGLYFGIPKTELLKSCREVMVYSLRTNCWKTIEKPHLLSSPNQSYHTSLLPWSDYYKTSVIVNGRIHWMSIFGGNDQGQSFGIIAFDLNTEVFSLINSPQQVKGPTVKGIGKMSECLSFILDTRESIEIWVMKEYGVTESWIKHMTIDIVKCPIPRSKCFCAPLSLGNKSYVLFHSYNKLFWYDLKSNTLGHSPSAYSIQFALYAESIGSFWGDKPQDDKKR
ncbi:F-box domain containing protein [Trema orientale]|uniref:F-box domain containing protein n=1 Tax=Trema orientale TaxID=63057 RepID=A0A2P5CBC3_TREOI|nr:F-box domain containing protein [Trema orientale]